MISIIRGCISLEQVAEFAGRASDKLLEASRRDLLGRGALVAAGEIHEHLSGAEDHAADLPRSASRLVVVDHHPEAAFREIARCRSDNRMAKQAFGVSTKERQRVHVSSAACRRSR